MSSAALAAVLHRTGPAGPGRVQLEDRELGPPGEGEVAIDVTACGVCRTDLQLCEGDLTPHRLPIVPGHQIVGRVAGVGPGVERIGIGDRVGVAWLASTCRRCRFCTAGRENLCEQARFTGWDRDGGFARRALAHEGAVHRLPDGPADEDLAPLLCGGAIGVRSLRVSGIAPGQRLGLYGFGASATIVIQVARSWGCEVHVVTRSAAEQRRARRLGAAWAGSYDERPPVPLDAAITFAPVGEVVIAALGALDRGGTVAINAIHLDRIPAFDYESLWWERSLRSVANVTAHDVATVLELARTVPLVTEVESFALEDADEALVALRDGRVRGAAVLRC